MGAHNFINIVSASSFKMVVSGKICFSPVPMIRIFGIFETFVYAL